ncbi:AP endonuclease family 2 protein [Tokyovirus A1]|uniref:AP endonuclease family 2 protein n=1 Tax=Tokyovirus A1 TaxID=1826170 RepID=UPI0007A96E77|nr:AP endonuclease family 2 protein [Tokyovirus A1]BAU80210.1 AP endonuclease family 2 protein [Tokyovirus A1]
MSLCIGSHISFSSKDGICKSVESDLSLDCYQLYISNPKAFSSTEYKESDLLSFRKSGKKLFVHASLIYNLCGSKEGEDCPKYKRNLEFTRRGLAHDLDVCALMGARGLVVHVGAARDREWGCQKVAETVNFVLKERSKLTDRYSEILGKDIRKERTLLLENCAGEGTKLGRDIPELFKIWSLIERKEQVGFCVDTCHGFASGSMDFGKTKGIDSFWREWEEHFPKESLRLFHLNDSKGILGCKVDRHETLLCGRIWENKPEVLAHFLEGAKGREIPLVLERKDNTVEKELEICRALVE